MSIFKLYLTTEETIDIPAERFEIESGGTIVFYRDDPESLTTGPEAFAAYSTWESVMET
jgi:hypothetical protein